MTAANSILAREISGQTVYKTSAAWEYRFIKSINELKARGSEQASAISITASRTTCVAHGGVFLDVDISGLTAAEKWFEEVEIYWDYGNSGEVFTTALRSDYDDYIESQLQKLADFMGRQARFSKGPFGATCYKRPGTYTITCHVFNNVNNEWSSDSVEITVVDASTIYDADNTFVVSVDNDFTGAPAGAQYTDPVAALDAAITFDQTCAVLFKAGESHRITSTNVAGKFRQADADFYIGTWEAGKSLHDAGQFTLFLDFTYSVSNTALIQTREHASFTITKLDVFGMYNPDSSQSVVIDGESVSSGSVGGNNNAEVQFLWAGIDGTTTTQVAANNLTISDCNISRTETVRLGSVTNAVFHNTVISDWSNIGIFADYTNGLARCGMRMTVPINCVERENQERDLTVRPLAPLHGAVREVTSVRICDYANIMTARSGWFGLTSSQPAVRYSTSPYGYSPPEFAPKVSSFYNILVGGDVAFIAEAQNPFTDTPKTEFIVVDSCVIYSTKHMYDGGPRWSHGNSVFKNCIEYIPRVAQQGLNQTWHGVNFWRNGGPIDPASVSGTLDEIMLLDASLTPDETAWPSDFDISLQSKGGEWVLNADKYGYPWYPTTKDNTTQTEANILLLDAVTNDGLTYEASDTGKTFIAIGGHWLPYRTGTTRLGDFNSTKPSVYSESQTVINMTIINKQGVTYQFYPYVPLRNKVSQALTGEAFSDIDNASMLSYVQAFDDEGLEEDILNLSPAAYEGQAMWATDTTTAWFSDGSSWIESNGDAKITATTEFNFDDTLKPAVASVSARDTRRAMDFYLNVITDANNNDGAVEGEVIY